MRRDDWLLAQLPVEMSEEDFLRRFLHIFQDIADTVLQQIDVLDRAFDPTVAPDSMVRQMGRWIGIEVDSSFDEQLQREAVRVYAAVLPWRGTAKGLAALLRLFSGSDDVVVKDTGGVFPEGEAPRSAPHVTLEMPPLPAVNSELTTRWTNPDDIVRMVRSELPAGVTFELWIAGRLVWPADRSGGAAEQRATLEVS